MSELSFPQRLKIILECSPHDLERWVNDEFCQIRERIAARTDCPAHILEKLSTDWDIGVRAAVALNINCPYEVLIKLSQDEDSEVCAAVASNLNCPIEILRQLSDFNDNLVRKAVASNLNCPVDLLEKLFEDEDLEVSLAVVHNKNCPLGVFEKLTDCRDNVHPILLEAALNHVQCPETLLEQMSADFRWWIRRAVAENPNCSDKILCRLINDGDVEVFESVLRRNQLSLSVIESGLQGRNSFRIREWLNQNKKKVVKSSLIREVDHEISGGE